MQLQAGDLLFEDRVDLGVRRVGAPYQTLPTADGDMILAVGNDAQFARFCAVAGHPEWATDERFATNPQRVVHRNVLTPMLRQTTVMKTTAEWVALLDAWDVPCGPVNRMDQVFADPQVQHRGLRIEMPHPLAGGVPLVANPIRLSVTPIEYVCPPPTLGQHTAQVLHDWLHLNASELQGLQSSGVL